MELADVNILAVGGGVFLNILANSHISKYCSAYHVPSAPHDAGISVGCAFSGAAFIGDVTCPPLTDRIGALHSPKSIVSALCESKGFVRSRSYSIEEIVAELDSGKIVARWNGRSEFGPRALGGRSLLASPLRGDAKERLNRIKDRQSWRPVAPVVPADEIFKYFIGPTSSYWMTMSHLIRPEHRLNLPALSHPDDSTRVQALLPEHDEELFSLLKLFGLRTGYSILCNTSLNRGGEPIVESAKEAIAMFLDQPEIDLLILGEHLIVRVDPIEELATHKVKLNEASIITHAFKNGLSVFAITDGNKTWRISKQMKEAIEFLALQPLQLGELCTSLNGNLSEIDQLRSFLIDGLLVVES
jgi:carbamoyltransferase